jgi:hypothetical protein
MGIALPNSRDIRNGASKSRPGHAGVKLGLAALRRELAAAALGERAGSRHLVQNR